MVETTYSIQFAKRVGFRDFQIFLKAITIFTASTARKLLKDGYKLVDIKPDKTDEDGKRTVFVFVNENNILDKVKEYKEK